MTTGNGSLKAPFPWFGGKSRVADLVWSRFGNVPNFVEPFFGSGAVLFGRPHEPHIETVNDLDCYVANFWRALQADAAAVTHWADWPVNECVPEGTMISTPIGEIPVEQITTGTIVWGLINGELTPTEVIATKQGPNVDPLVNVDGLSLTKNHPVWTLENGYIPAERLTQDMSICTIEVDMHLPVDKPDLGMLYYWHEQKMGNLYTNRSFHAAGALRGCDVSGQKQIQRAHVTCHKGRTYAPGLLDSVFSLERCTAYLHGCDDWIWRRVARGRTSLDSQISRNGQFDQSHRRRGRDTWICSDARTPAEMVEDASWHEIRAWSHTRNARQETYDRSKRKDPAGRYRAQAYGRSPSKSVKSTQGEAPLQTTSTKVVKGAYWQNAVRRTQAKDSRIDTDPKASYVCRDGPSLRVYHRYSSGVRRVRSLYIPSYSQGLPLQRRSPTSRVAFPVFNFQTTTGNYFANGVLVHNCDLHARHWWLVRQAGFRERMHEDPDYYDAKVAGWWVWGICQWIGSGWCSYPEWQKRPHLGSRKGVHRPSQKLPHLSRGRGVHRLSQQLPNISGPGRGHPGSADHAGYGDLYAYMLALSQRLRKVRVCCGDFQRVLGPTPTFKQGLTGVFLDPPYASEHRDRDLYAVDSMDVGHRAAAWAIENGDNPLLRIALCGYEDDYEMPGDWECIAWKARGGYGSQGNGDNQNARRERVWFSPHCLEVERHRQLALFGACKTAEDVVQ